MNVWSSFRTQTRILTLREKERVPPLSQAPRRTGTWGREGSHKEALPHKLDRAPGHRIWGRAHPWGEGTLGSRRAFFFPHPGSCLGCEGGSQIWRDTFHFTVSLRKNILWRWGSMLRIREQSPCKVREQANSEADLGGCCGKFPGSVFQPSPLPFIPSLVDHLASSQADSGWLASHWFTQFPNCCALPGVASPFAFAQEQQTL